MAVSDKVISRCREALGAGMPLIYIKTDSEELIQKVVNSDRLVMRLCGQSAGPLWAGRPLREKEASTIGNYSRGLLCKGAVKNYLTWSYPHIHVCRAEAAWTRETFAQFEEYIMCHENVNSGNYDVLQSSAVILFASEVYVSPMMQMYTEFIDVDLPDREEIHSQILNEAYRYGDTELLHNEEYVSGLCSEFSGFTGEEIHMTMRKVMSRETPDQESPLHNSEKVIGLIREHKKSKMQNGILTLRTDTDGAIGGMKNLTDWLGRQDTALKQAELLRRKKGIQPPKGVLVCGIPGCGKSEAAKATARTFGLPLLQMDIGSLMGKYVGESEHNMTAALRLAETMSPCILWIDELDKGFSAAGSRDDSGPFKRMFGNLLGWMQDNKKPCFIFATANDIGGLPKEFFRSGRFDAVYAVYLPTAEECVQIFIARMKKIQEDVQKAAGAAVFEEECLEEAFLREMTDRCLVKNGVPRIVVGADIQKIVNTALIQLQEHGGRITRSQWAKQLELAIDRSTVYGDGYENIDSIAIGYCRMLRKGLVPAAGTVLFRAEDYQAGLLAGASGQEQTEVLRESPEAESLRGYDRAVYQLLRTRINELAPELERYERQAMLKR